MKYNIHDMIKFEILDKRKYIARKIDSFYNHFGYYIDKNDSQDLDFIINISEFSPKNEQCNILDGKYYVKQDYIYCEDKKKLSKWKVEIKNLDDSLTTVNISINTFGSLSVLTNFTEFLIHLKMAEHGYPLIHASGILINNRGIAFAARSGGGKTTIVTYLMEKGFKYFGDNFIIIHDDQIHNFLSPLNLYTYNLTPIIKKHLDFRKKITILTKNVLYIVSGRYAKLSTTLNLFDIIPEQVADHGKLDTLFLIIPKTNFSIKKMSKNELVDHLVQNQQIEFMHMPFLNYLHAYSYVFPNSKIGSHWEIYKESLTNAISNETSILKIEVPRKYNNSVIEELLNLVRT